MIAFHELRFPAPRIGRAIAIGVAAFAPTSAIAGIILAAIEGPGWETIALVFGALFAASVIAAGADYGYTVASVALRRAREYTGLYEHSQQQTAVTSKMQELLRGLNSELQIQAIRDIDGTVNLVFPYGTQHGLQLGSTIEIVRRSGGERLGYVRVTQATEAIVCARPIDRTDTLFWEGLEDRMKHDFSPPADVIGRVYAVTGQVISDLLGILGDDDEE